MFADVTPSLRALRRSPAFAVTACLTIALGVGVNTAVFTWLENLVLEPYPEIRDPSSVVALNARQPDGSSSGAPPLSYRALEDGGASGILAAIGAYGRSRVSVRIAGEPAGVAALAEPASGNFFDVLGVRPGQGRYLTPRDETLAEPVAVLSDSFWRRRFRADAAVIGSRIRVNNVPVTIAGVAPAGFSGLVVGLDVDLWYPLTLQPSLAPGSVDPGSRGSRWLQGFGRLRPGAGLIEARAALDQVAQRVSREHGEYPVTGAAVRRPSQLFLGSLVGPLLSAMLAVTALLFAACCANVANLVLARSHARQREAALRLALGSSRARLIRTLCTESLLLALAGGALGVALGSVLMRLLPAFLPDTGIPARLRIAFDPAVAGFAALLTFLCLLLFGLLPALRASRLDLAAAIKTGGSAGESSGRWSNALVVSQVAFAVVALLAASLFGSSLRAAGRLDLGFGDPAGLLLISTDFAAAGLAGPRAALAAEALLEKARAQPGVRQAAFSSMIPLGFGGHSFSPVEVPGYLPGPSERMDAERVSVTAGYFESIEIPIAAGRAIDARDLAGSQRIAVVNLAFAARYFPGQDPLGRRFRHGPDWVTVAGVARNAAYADLGESPYPVVYHPWTQWYTPAATLQVRAPGGPKLLIENLRREFRNVNANLLLLEPRTLAEHMGAATFVQRLGASVLGAFGAIGLALAAVGVYGALTCRVAERRREIAVRLAIGASPRQVLRGVCATGLRLAASGLAAGTGLSIALGRLLRGQVPGAGPLDPAALAAAAVLLLGVAATASLVPALRASRQDPAAVLKSQ